MLLQWGLYKYPSPLKLSELPLRLISPTPIKPGPLRDPQVREILQKAKADGYQVNVDARPMFDLQELGETEKGKVIALIPRKELPW
ncbi:MAG: hypothetical protein AOA65_0660 [Candidatus Bathyarchaeota archaeon BA1]|nr:MAG: hypothetical protein AOA65_0660 [Candidatus Bathyarchaeota archaeon BA1]